jgi:hypothetical protein
MEADEVWVNRKLGRVSSRTFTSRMCMREVEFGMFTTGTLAGTKTSVLVIPLLCNEKSCIKKQKTCGVSKG